MHIHTDGLTHKNTHINNNMHTKNIINDISGLVYTIIHIKYTID